MFAKKKEGQRFMILISSGTCDATKVHVAVTNGFAQLKGDATTKVDFVLMAEGGWVVEDKVLRSIGAFGLPPMSKLLDDPCMQDALASARRWPSRLDHYVSIAHLEHLECSYQPHIQGRGAQKRTQRAG